MKPVKGIFATWEGSIMEKPETVFKKSLETNPVYPFEEVEPYVYVLTVKTVRSGFSFFLCAITIIVTCTIYLSHGSVNEFVVVPVVVFVGFFLQALSYVQERTYVLDGKERMYEFYRGNRLVYRGDYHNAYIRLKGIDSGGGNIYYSVVLNGFELDEEAITPASTRHKKLARLGRRLAHHLDLNFFDYQDKSRHHVIRHRCPYKDSSAHQVNV